MKKKKPEESYNVTITADYDNPKTAYMVRAVFDDTAQMYKTEGDGNIIVAFDKAIEMLEEERAAQMKLRGDNIIKAIRARDELFKEKPIYHQPGTIKKPPLGVTPPYFWRRERKEELLQAIVRYGEAELKIPEEWLREFNELNNDNLTSKQVQMVIEEDDVHEAINTLNLAVQEGDINMETYLIIRKVIG